MTTLADLLFEPGADAAAELAGAFTRVPAALGQLSVSGLSIPTDDVAKAVATLLDVPIGNLAVRGWNDHRTVTEAKRRTAEDHTMREVVRLLEHRMKIEQEPEIEAEVNGVVLPLIRLKLKLEIRLSSADLVVERGRVGEVRPGAAVATATLSASKVVLARKEFRPVEVRPGPRPDDLKPTGPPGVMPPPPRAARPVPAPAGPPVTLPPPPRLPAPSAG